VFDGIKPAVVAIVFFAVWRIGSRALRNRLLWTIAALSFLAIFVFKVRFPLIVLGAGLLGSVGGWIWPELFRVGAVHGDGGAAPSGPAVIDDDSVTPAHARFDPVRLALLALVFAALWAAAVLLIEQPLLRSMALFFTKAALLTFGGAYAVLPYVYQGAVETHQWLTGAQMIDGLALGETTPGPLIMVVAFVGFVGGWGGGIFGADMPVLGGIAGASVATLFTFLPGYLFILAGAPLVESTQGNLRFTAPLTAITAAVVGVVLNLALFFAWHLLWPEGTDAEPFSGPFQWFHALLSVAAFIALRVFGQGIVRVIAACAVIGLVQTFAVGA
jgi:chromate transporter